MAENPGDGRGRGGERKAGFRRRVLMAVINLVVLALLLATYVVYAVVKGQPPVATWLAETWVERLCRQLPARLWRRRDALARRARDMPLLPEEQERAGALLDLMERIRPSHALRLKSGELLFVQMRPQIGDPLTVSVCAGTALEPRQLRRREIAVMKPLVVPEVALAPWDLRFLIAFGDMAPYLMPPYLVVSDSDYGRTYELYMTLVALEEAFRAVFAPLVEEPTERGLRHICFFADERAFLDALSAHGLHRTTLNAVGFFQESDHTLFLHDDPFGASAGTISGFHRRSRKRVEAIAERPLSNGLVPIVRHEGTHLFCALFGVLPARERLPGWVVEGMAQYFETAVPGALNPPRLAALQQALGDRKLIPWEVVVADLSGGWELGEEYSPELVYAQFWWLFRHLMTPPYRAKFFRYLAALRAPDAVVRPVDVLNTLGTTASKLSDELTASIPVAVVD